MIYKKKPNLALNNLQWLICHKPNQTKSNNVDAYGFYLNFKHSKKLISLDYKNIFKVEYQPE